MSDQRELLCPNTGEMCQYTSYCRAAKDASESEDEIFGGPAVSVLNERVREASQSSYCSDKRILALGEIAYGADANTEVGDQALDLADSIAFARMLFLKPVGSNPSTVDI